MYRRDVPKYVLNDVLQESRQTEEKILRGRFASPSEQEQLVRRIIYLERRLAEFADDPKQNEHLRRADRYAALIGLAPTNPAPPPPAPAGYQPKDPAAPKAKVPNQAPDEDDFGAVAERMIRTSSLRWEQIAGLQKAKNAILTTMRLFSMEKPAGMHLPIPDKFLLFGPPGTGKTMLASAAAATNGMTFFEVGVSSDLKSKWVGESPKILKAVYKKAEERAPSIVFMDEVTLLVSQSDTQHEVSTELHDTFLTLLDGFGSKTGSSKVLTVATTNRPWQLSDAMKSRFQKQIYVPLPDLAARTEILRYETRGHQVQVPVEELAARTEFYSGRDLKNLCSEAIQLMVMDANPNITSPTFVGGGKVLASPITGAHFATAFETVRPASTAEDVRAFEDYQRRGG